MFSIGFTENGYPSQYLDKDIELENNIVEEGFNPGLKNFKKINNFTINQLQPQNLIWGYPKTHVKALICKSVTFLIVTSLTIEHFKTNKQNNDALPNMGIAYVISGLVMLKMGEYYDSISN